METVSIINYAACCMYSLRVALPTGVRTLITW